MSGVQSDDRYHTTVVILCALIVTGLVLASIALGPGFPSFEEDEESVESPPVSDFVAITDTGTEVTVEQTSNMTTEYNIQSIYVVSNDDKHEITENESISIEADSSDWSMSIDVRDADDETITERTYSHTDRQNVTISTPSDQLIVDEHYDFNLSLSEGNVAHAEDISWYIDSRDVSEWRSTMTESFDERGYYTLRAVVEYEGVTYNTSQTMTVMGPHEAEESGSEDLEIQTSEMTPTTSDQIQFSVEDRTGGIVNQFYWDFDSESEAIGANQTQQFETPGEYNVTVTAEYNHSESRSNTRQIMVYPEPPTVIADVSSQSGTMDDSFEFTPVVSENEDDIDLTYTWAFDDSSTLSGDTIWNSYDAPGEYNVTLVASDEFGQEYTDTVSVSIHTRKPNAAFNATPTTGYVGNTYNFNASDSNDPDGSSLTYAWEFSDGERASGESTARSFSDTGEYQVKLTVEDEYGNIDSTSSTITVESRSPEAVAEVSPLERQQGEPFNFDGTNSSDPDSSELTYEWSLGDGSLSQDPSLLHEYDEPGEYDVSLTVTDEFGNTDTDDLTVTVTSG